MTLTHAASLLLLPLLPIIPSLRAAEAPSAKPNVIVILMDDMAYGDIGPFGSKLNRTPELDRMAREGMKMTSFYCASVCSASRAQLLTGSYAKRVSVGLFQPISKLGLNPDEITLPELLKAQGYTTMMIGKWHLGDQPEFLPTRQGFDRFFGLPYSNDQFGNGKPDKYGEIRPPLPLLLGEKVVEAPVKQEPLTERFTKEAVKFITENQKNPFFLYFAHIATHVPMMPGEAFKGKSPNGLYSDWTEEADWSVGRVLQTLRDLKLDRNTLVIFTSDNGPWLSKTPNCGVPTPLTGGKFTCREGGVREPALAWWPGKIPANAVSDAVLSEMDILPTVVGLAGGKVPTDRKIDGLDIWPLLSGKKTESPHESLFYWEGSLLTAIRAGAWKLLIQPFKDEGSGKNDKAFVPRLYNLDKDIAETTDVAAQNPEVVKRLRGYTLPMEKDLGLAGQGPGVRPPGKVEQAKPLLLKAAAEYD